MDIPGEKSLTFMVKVSKPNRYLYSKRVHIRIQCLQYKPPQMEKKTWETHLENVKEMERVRDIEVVDKRIVIKQSEWGVSSIERKKGKTSSCNEKLHESSEHLEKIGSSLRLILYKQARWKWSNVEHWKNKLLKGKKTHQYAYQNSNEVWKWRRK